MMKVTCDRCGKLIDIDYMTPLNFGCETPEWSPSVMLYAKDPDTGGARKFDLCETCEKALYQFIFDDEVTKVEQANKITDCCSDS